MPPVLGLSAWLALVSAATILGLVVWTAWVAWRPGDGIDLPPPAFVEVDGLRIATYRIGQGPEILLIHGLGASTYCWRYLIEELKTDFTLIGVDLVGFGASSKPAQADFSLDSQGNWLHQALQQMGLKPVAIVGSSLGGLLALWLARAFDPTGPQLFLLAPATLGNRVRAFRPWQIRALVHLRLLLNRWSMAWMAATVIGSFRPLNRQALDRYLEPYRHPDAAWSFGKAFAAIADPRIPGIFRDVAVATVVFWGRRDLQVPRSAMLELKMIVPHAELIELNTAHHPQEHIPKILAETIRARLDDPLKNRDQSRS